MFFKKEKYLRILLPLMFFTTFLNYNVAAKNITKNLAIDGFVNFSATNNNQNSAFENSTLPNSYSQNKSKNSLNVGNDSQLFFKVNDKFNDVKYGIISKVEFNFNSDERTQNPNLDQAHLFFDNKFGKIEFGNTKAANQQMKAGPAKFARGAGGINGKYLENINLPISSSNSTNIKSTRFILLAQSPIGHNGYGRSFENFAKNDDNGFNRSNFRALKDDSFDGMEDATKLSYYIPRIAGLQLGFSYTPNSLDSGITSTKYYNYDQIEIENIFSFGANYLQYFDNLALELSLTAEKGNFKSRNSTLSIARQDLLSYDLGATVSYFGFDIGASYGSWTKSLQAKTGINSCEYNSTIALSSQNCASNANRYSNPYYYTLGIAYSFGPIATSITALRSEFESNKYDAISLGLDYKILKGLMPYFEVTRFNLKSNQPKAFDLVNQGDLIYDNQGYVFLTGILISF